MFHSVRHGRAAQYPHKWLFKRSHLPWVSSDEVRRHRFHSFAFDDLFRCDGGAVEAASKDFSAPVTMFN
jgi:hypothetical protein